MKVYTSASSHKYFASTFIFYNGFSELPANIMFDSGSSSMFNIAYNGKHHYSAVILKLPEIECPSFISEAEAKKMKSK